MYTMYTEWAPICVQKVVLENFMIQEHTQSRFHKRNQLVILAKSHKRLSSRSDHYVPLKRAVRWSCSSRVMLGQEESTGKRQHAHTT
jgi:hypothetical protein